jgi:hypothetical protein
MSKNLLRAAAALATACVVASASAAPPIAVNPNAKLAPKKIPQLAVLRPDYAVRAVEQTIVNGKIESLKITIVDLCNAKVTASPYVAVNAYTVLGYNAVFTGGASESVMALPLGSSVPAGTKIRVSVNDDKAVPEAWSGNNFLEKNPDVAPFPAGKNYCLPQNYEN